MRSPLSPAPLLAAAAAALSLLAPAVSDATVVIQPSLEEMAQRSDVVVHAVVEEQTVTRGEEGKRILTLSRLRIVDGLKGAQTGETVTLYQVGGSEGGRVARVVGMSEFKVGEEVVLFAATFLATDTVRYLQEHRKADVPAATLHPSAGWVVTYGVGLGKFAVTQGPNGAMAVEEIGDLATMKKVGNGIVPAPTVRTTQPLGVFKSTVREIVGGQP